MFWASEVWLVRRLLLWVSKRPCQECRPLEAQERLKCNLLAQTCILIVVGAHWCSSSTLCCTHRSMVLVEAGLRLLSRSCIVSTVHSICTLVGRSSDQDPALACSCMFNLGFLARNEWRLRSGFFLLDLGVDCQITIFCTVCFCSWLCVQNKL